MLVMAQACELGPSFFVVMCAVCRHARIVTVRCRRRPFFFIALQTLSDFGEVGAVLDMNVLSSADTSSSTGPERARLAVEYGYKENDEDVS